MSTDVVASQAPEGLADAWYTAFAVPLVFLSHRQRPRTHQTKESGKSAWLFRETAPDLLLCIYLRMNKLMIDKQLSLIVSAVRT